MDFSGAITRRDMAQALAGAALLAGTGSLTLADTPGPLLHLARIGGDIGLNYVEGGLGEPVIFVHGSLSDYSYWRGAFGTFSRRNHAIAYSRRYNWPNHNPARAGYSAFTDARDLARLIEALGLGRVHLVGHSYGAFASLILATTHPDLIRTLTLAEPPAVSLLAYVQGPRTAEAAAMLSDIDTRMVTPMRAAFARGDREGGVVVFIDYVFRDPHAWDKFSPDDRVATLRDAHEWDVMMTTGTLFPPISPKAVAAIRTPTLILSGAKSYPFLGLIDGVLERLIPGNRRILIPDAGHQMWLQAPDTCRDAVFELMDKNPRA